MKIIAVIPARYKSSRLPGKPLLLIKNKPMVWWVYQHALKSKCFDVVIVATDDKRILNTCKKYNINCMLTSPKHNTPTSRIYEVSKKIKGDMFCFIGGDEPLILENHIKKVVSFAIKNNTFVSHGMTNIKTSPEVLDVANIKLSVSSSGRLLYCTRSPIPFPKGGLNFKYKKFVGLGVFSAKSLQFYNDTIKGEIEKIEECDLLRFIENGKIVNMVDLDCLNVSIDTKKDYEYLLELIGNKKCKI